MSYTQAEVGEMIQKIADVQNLQNGKTQTRFDAYDSEIEELKSTTEAIGTAVARSLAPPGGDGGYTRGIFKNLGDFASAVARSSSPGGVVDERLLRVQAAASGGNETIPSEGGFLVEKELRDPLLANVFKNGEFAKRCVRFEIGANANGLTLPLPDETSRANGSRFGGIQVYHAAEAEEFTATKIKWRKLNLHLHKLIGLSYVTEELMQDAPSLGQFLQMAFSEEFSFKLDDVIINGTGAGQGLGVMNAGCKVAIPKESGQPADTVVFENITKMYSRMLPRSRKNAIWLINQQVEPQLYTMSLTAGTGGVAVFLPASGAAGRPYQTLYGLPIIPCEQCAALGDEGDIILADFGEMVFIDKGAIKSASSLAVRFLYDEQAFKWTYRYDCQPLRASALSPFKGSDPLSGFITLAERN